jgi:hypothetical protein
MIIDNGVQSLLFIHKGCEYLPESWLMIDDYNINLDSGL